MKDLNTIEHESYKMWTKIELDESFRKQNVCLSHRSKMVITK